MIIYRITNIINSKVYIGQTSKTLTKRFSGHISDSKRFDTKLCRAIRKYGKENFKMEIIIEGDFNKELTDHLETHYIQLYASRIDKKGYNIKLGGNSVVMSDETKIKISLKNKGKKHPPRIKYKNVDRYGQERANEISEKRSIATAGYKNPRARRVVNTNTNKIFGTILEAAISININRKSLSNFLNGSRQSKKSKMYPFKFLV